MRSERRLKHDGDVRIVTRHCFFPKVCYTKNEDGTSTKHFRWMETVQIEQEYQSDCWETGSWVNIKFID